MSACDCATGQLQPVDQAIAALLAQAPPLPAVEQVSIHDCAGRVLAEVAHAPRPMPAWDNSAMDGYALRAADLPAEGGWLPLAGRVAAGDTRGQRLRAGHASRIFTGAPLPHGADTVVAQEQARVEGDRVWLEGAPLGNHVRRRGEEFSAGDPLLAAGQRLRPQDVGLLASLGIANVPVYRPLRVALLSSGNELRDPGEELAPGQIYNANYFSLSALLRGWGCEVDDGGVLADELLASRDALSVVAAEWDLIMTSGGVSVGEEDHLKQAVRDLGQLHLWRLAIQPGKPFAFGYVAGTPWLGLPGNPMAALLTAMVVARPFILRAQGREQILPQTVPVAAGFDWPKDNRRRQYLRANLRYAEGGLCAVPVTRQGSAMLTGACLAEGLIIVEVNRTLREGETVEFLPFSELLS